MTKPQIIRDDSGNPAYAVIPWPEYECLDAAKAEASLSDEALYDRAKADDEESFPMELADRLLAGESAISIYRDYRGMTRKQLAEVVGINPIYLSQIEKGRRNGSTGTLVAIARALRVDVDALV